MTEIIVPIITGIVCLAVGVVIGFLYRKSVAEKAIGDAETEATRIINEAIKAGETKKRESILEAKDEIHRQRVEADRELKERRNETQQLERRLIQREEALDKKSSVRLALTNKSGAEIASVDIPAGSGGGGESSTTKIVLLTS